MTLPITCVLAKVYKTLLLPSFNYSDIICDKTEIESLKNKIWSIWSRSYIAITGAIHGTSKMCVYENLGLESLTDNFVFRKLTFFDYCHSFFF